MVAYKENELVSATELVKKLGRFVSKIKDQEIEKIGILKNNRLEAVIISTKEYEFLKKLEESFLKNTKEMKPSFDIEKDEKSEVDSGNEKEKESEASKTESLNRIKIIDELDVPTWHRIAKEQGYTYENKETDSDSGSRQ